MQVSLNQVVVQLSSTARVGDGGPVFSVSNAPVQGLAINQVQLSAAARAMAEVSNTGTRPQLALFVQWLGSQGPGAARSFTPTSPAAAAAERFQPLPADLGQQARAEAADDAQQLDAALAATRAAALSDGSPTSLPRDVVSAATGSVPAPVAAYLQAAAPAAAPAAPTVNLSA